VRCNLLILFFSAVFLLPAVLSAQSADEDFYVTPESVLRPDTVSAEEIVLPDIPAFAEEPETDAPEKNATPADSAAKEVFKPDADKAVWLGAIIPGFGQIVNRKYWKLPIAYGGYMGCAFAVTWLSGEYNFYKYAYRDIIDSDETTNSFLHLIPEGYKIEDFFGSMDGYRNVLKSRMDNYRRYRDLSILFSILYHGLVILEAYVDAQLYDFDISPDLSMHLQPAIINNEPLYAGANYGFGADGFGQTNAKLGYSSAFGIRGSIRLK